jgi:hypothetical protein
MEGSYYKSHSICFKISVPKDIRLDMHIMHQITLETGSTQLLGGLGTTGVKPTYLITIKILNKFSIQNK